MVSIVPVVFDTSAATSIKMYGVVYMCDRYLKGWYLKGWFVLRHGVEIITRCNIPPWRMKHISAPVLEALYATYKYK